MMLNNPRCVAPNDIDLRHYRCLQEGCGVVDLSHCSQFELQGRDRRQFLHNLCTNDILQLEAGQGCEAFVTSVQGRCLGHVLVFAGVESLVVETVPEQADVLLPHWERYHISEDVQLADRSLQWGQLLLAGPDASQLLRGLIADWALDRDYAHQSLLLGQSVVWARRAPLTTAPTYLLACQRPELPGVLARLQAAGVTQCSPASFHIARIEQGFPWYGWDITEKNLPQEVHRDQQAISFQKGCYLGQETVARIDALGHVNRMLVGLRCQSASVPEADAPITIDGQQIGQVTSATFSPRWSAALALAYVRSQYSRDGTAVELPGGSASIVPLPI